MKPRQKYRDMDVDRYIEKEKGRRVEGEEW